MDTNTSSGTSYLIASTIVPVALASHLLLDEVNQNIIDNSGWACDNICISNCIFIFLFWSQICN